MAIPLVGSPPPTKINVIDLLVGDSSDFTGGVGNWVQSGGAGTTISVSSLYKLEGRTNSLKLARSAQNQGAAVSVTGTFSAGKEYHLLVSVHYEDVDWASNADSISETITLAGNNGGSYAANQSAVYPQYAYVNSSGSDFTTRVLPWRPTVNHTSALISIMPSASTAGYAYNVYVGEVRLVEVQNQGDSGLLLSTGPLPVASAYQYPEIWVGDRSTIGVGNAGSYIKYQDYMLDFRSDSGGWSGMQIGSGGPTGASSTYTWAEHPVSYSTNGGLDFEVGPDYDGIMIFQADTDVVAIQADYSYGYQVKLLDRGPDPMGWIAESTGGGRSIRLSRAVESPLIAEDDLIVGGVTTPYTESNRVNQTDDPYYMVGGGEGEGLSIRNIVSAPWPVLAGEPISVTYDYWYSHYSNGSPTGTKTTSVRLRRTNATGAQLAIQTTTDTATSTLGRSYHFTGTYTDNSPTDGVYVITFETDAASPGGVMATDRILSISTTGAGYPTVLSKGSDYSVLQVSPVTSHVSWQAPGLVGSVGPTGAYTLVLTDAGKVIELDSGSAQTLTVPENASVAFLVGTTIGVYQAGAGQITVSPTGAATLRAPNGTKTAAQYSTAQLRKRATDEWVLSGDTAV